MWNDNLIGQIFLFVTRKSTMMTQVFTNVFSNLILIFTQPSLHLLFLTFIISGALHGENKPKVKLLGVVQGLRDH